MPRAISLGAMALLALTVAVNTAHADECREFGEPSYVATRTITHPGVQIVTRIMSRSGLEREESRQAGSSFVRIVTPEAVFIFDEAKKTGMRLPPLPSPPARAKSTGAAQPGVKIDKDVDGELQTVTIRQKVGDSWQPVLKVACRKDGVLVSREFPMLLPDGKWVAARLSHTDIVVGPQADALFQVPADIKLTTPPPPPRPKQ